MRIVTVVGARPQLIKAAAGSRVLRKEHQEILVHTGQHFDDNMSAVFFREMGIPAPDYYLGISCGSHAQMTAKMLVGIEEILMKEEPDALLVYGDTNSTLAGAVAAAKLHVPIFHVEAGLRSFNMSMPEEQNRIVCDHLSSILFAPTQTAVDNLVAEGLVSSKAMFQNGKGREVIKSGDVMYDNAQ